VRILHHTGFDVNYQLMKIVFMGTPDFAVPTLKALHHAGYDIPLVVSQPDRPKGRGRKIISTPVKKVAVELGIPVYQPENINSDEALEKLSELQPDYIVVVAFGQILKKRILDVPKQFCVNLHGSLLPLLRGAGPMQRAIMEGHLETGVTTMKMARKMDAGDMLLKESLPITGDTSFGSLHDELSQVGAEVMIKTFKLLEAGELKPEVQDKSKVSFAPKILPQERMIDWNERADVIDRQIRGLSPTPSAYTTFNGKRILVLEAKLLEGGARLPAGSISRIKGGLEVDAGSGRLALLTVRPQGKNVMEAVSWANGVRLDKESCFT